VGTAAYVSDINIAGALLHGQEQAACGDAAYQGVHSEPKPRADLACAMRPGKRPAAADKLRRASPH
jgi:IS5 family transposase